MAHHTTTPARTGGADVWFVYILKSLKNGRFYTGSTNDVDRRFAEHQRGKSPATKHLRPFALVHTERHPTRLAARCRERFLKSGQGREELRDCSPARIHRAVAGGDRSVVRTEG